MYVGRIVGVAKTKDNRNVALFRISSRSFPNRKIIERDRTLAVVPKEGFEAESAQSPYVSYTAMQEANDLMVVANGFHGDTIANLIKSGTPTKQSLALALSVFDNEPDEFDTPRIAAVVPIRGDKGFLGIVSKDRLEVKQVSLRRGECCYVATYEVTVGGYCVFLAKDNKDISRYLIDDPYVFNAFENPVAAAAAVGSSGGWDYETYNLD